MSLKKQISKGEFIVLAEMDTPKGVDISELVTNARRVKGRVDAVVIPDMANGVMRMSSIGGGVVMHRQGLECVAHICPRDRNRLSLQGDLLAAHVLGIDNLMVVAGDDMSLSDHIDAKVVADLDVLQLLQAIQILQKGTDMAGIDLTGAPSFTVGCTMSPWADDAGLQAELELTRKKIELGAEYIVTPPFFDADRFAAFLKQAGDLGVPILPTVFLLKSVGTARYMTTNLPGIYIPEEMIKRIRRAPDRTAECVKIAGETVAAFKPLAGGVHLVTLGWEYRLPEILDRAGL